jgi:hypothetical protein
VVHFLLTSGKPFRIPVRFSYNKITVGKRVLLVPTRSLEKLEVGVAESGVMLALAGHFHNLEADRSLARLQMRRMQVKDCFILREWEKFK